jgi:N-methylhydantoinase A
VDSGGTFTDCVVFHGSRIEVRKIFSDPQDPAATLDAVRQLAGRRAASISILHGTTVGTNALLERRGARVALVTTAGFEDLIEIGRQNRQQLYELTGRRDPPLIGRSLRCGVAERTTAEGEILQPVKTAALQELLRRLRGVRPEAIAICLLFSYSNSANERAVARALRGFGLPVSVSHELLPEFREYERLSTTVINAYLAPRVGEYLRGLERAARREFAGRRLRRSSSVYVMQSNGGIATAARAAREPVRTILSGPAGGVVASDWLARILRAPKVMSFDMGGTSTDVCLLDGGPRATRETAVAGLPVAVPVLDVHAVGAGGGSLARLDPGGALRVGPESAGAAPGPACYGRGGDRPTITDAHLILGRLQPDTFLGGAFRLDVTSAERCFDDFLRRSHRSGQQSSAWRSRQELAAGIVAVGNATMEKALRVISVERGYDPREFSLVCFGGAGGLHAAELAGLLGLAQVIVPQNPGAFSALGVLLSDIVLDGSQSVLLPVPQEKARVGGFVDGLEQRFAGMERTARRQIRRDGFPDRAARITRYLDMRYRGQSFELSIPYGRGFLSAFHGAHQRAYGYSDPVRPLEVVSLRARLTVATPKPPVRRHRVARSTPPARGLAHTRDAWFGGRFLRTSIIERELLRAGTMLRGPAVVTEYSSTTVVPPEFDCRVDEFLNLVITRYAN